MGQGHLGWRYGIDPQGGYEIRMGSFVRVQQSTFRTGQSLAKSAQNS